MARTQPSVRKGCGSPEPPLFLHTHGPTPHAVPIARDLSTAGTEPPGSPRSKTATSPKPGAGPGVTPEVSACQAAPGRRGVKPGSHLRVFRPSATRVHDHVRRVRSTIER
eukprot:2870633-Prymnesium_polylepis.1